MAGIPNIKAALDTTHPCFYFYSPDDEVFRLIRSSAQEIRRVEFSLRIHRSEEVP